MSLKKKIESDLKDALKSKDADRVNTLRFFLASLKNQEIEEKKELSDDSLISLLSKEIKKRKESIDIYGKSGRAELADKEKKELLFLEIYLPEQLTDEELEKIVKSAISEVGAKDKSDMGKVMSLVMSKVQGKAQGGDVSKKVSNLLN